MLALHLDGIGIGYVGREKPQYDAVFVDTFRSVISPEDENNNAEIGRWLRQLRELAKLVVIIHHTNKGGEVSAGAGAFQTNTDAEINVKVVDGIKLMRQIVIGQNDDESEFDLFYRLEMHADSLVAVEADLDAVAGAKARVSQQSRDERTAEADAIWLELIADVADDDGWAGRSDIIGAASSTKSTVERVLSDMIRRQVLEKDKRGRLMFYRATTTSPTIENEGDGGRQ